MPTSPYIWRLTALSDLSRQDLRATLARDRHSGTLFCKQLATPFQRWLIPFSRWLQSRNLDSFSQTARRDTVAVPLSTLPFALCGLCCSVMWASVFNLSVEGLGKYTEAAAGLFMTFAVGGGAVPLAQGFVADKLGYMVSYAVPAIGLAYLALFAFVLSRVPEKEQL